MGEKWKERVLFFLYKKKKDEFRDEERMVFRKEYDKDGKPVEKRSKPMMMTLEDFNAQFDRRKITLYHQKKSLFGSYAHVDYANDFYDDNIEVNMNEIAYIHSILRDIRKKKEEFII